MLWKSGSSLFVGCVVGYLAFLGACSSSSDTKKNPLKTAEGFCESWAGAACNSKVIAACGSSDESADGCKATQASQCLTRVAASYDGTNAKECIAAVKSAYSDAKLTREELDLLELSAAPCDALFKGATPEGGDCTADDQCDTLEGYRCVGETDPTCQVPVEVSGGGRCNAPGSVCADGFYCNGQNCVAGVELAGACVDEPCIQSLRCFAGTCSARTADFQSCAQADECSSGLCDVPQGASTGICVPRLELGITSTTCSTLR